MFELAQFNVFTPNVRKGGDWQWRLIAMCWQAMGLGGMESFGRTWEWSPAWLEIMGIGGFDLSAANRGAYAGLVHNIASRPKSKSRTRTAPPVGGPPQPHPLHPRDAYTKGLMAMSPTLAMQGTVG